MKIQVTCFATLARYSPQGGVLEVNPGATPQDVLDLLAIPGNEVKIVFVNGQNSGRDVLLQENDRVGIFPAIGGG
ncbi:MoaD/ThiS family protein [Desulfonatronovibrio hydrogenovorans]|uniref:MoaD/ThiS family protein n=1 Tax=Desulfonatronovibrio hydrogenovorans TaxID=53245 RepID=UPI00048EDA20|nr:MoaD/ThiS family protein [Desulfonatronovibrio hydrogenovorans]